jgi:hypothetical protein
MRVSINTILQLPDELKYILRTIWHPEAGDAFFYLNPLTGPSAIFTYGKHNPIQFAEDRLNAYPLFTVEQMMKIIEDYGGYKLYKDVVNKATSVNELFTILWDTILHILEDGESPEYWALTVPVSERRPNEIDVPCPFNQ